MKPTPEADMVDMTTFAIEGRTTSAVLLPEGCKLALCAQMKRCGRVSCRCHRGELHGPYFALFWRQRGRLRKRYVRLSQVDAVRAELAARAEQRWLRRLAAKDWRNLWREQTASMREYERWIRK